MTDYFCLSADGEICVLGNHGDFDAAADTAANMGWNPVWIFDTETAREWRDVLTKRLDFTDKGGV
jgi:hypothetical protein